MINSADMKKKVCFIFIHTGLREVYKRNIGREWLKQHDELLPYWPLHCCGKVHSSTAHNYHKDSTLLGLDRKPQTKLPQTSYPFNIMFRPVWCVHICTGWMLDLWVVGWTYGTWCSWRCQNDVLLFCSVTCDSHVRVRQVWLNALSHWALWQSCWAAGHLPQRDPNVDLKRKWNYYGIFPWQFSEDDQWLPPHIHTHIYAH